MALQLLNFLSGIGLETILLDGDNQFTTKKISACILKPR